MSLVSLVEHRLSRLPVGAIVSTASDGVALTFDDGPDPSLTPGILEVLDRHRARATFFVLMSKVRRTPTLLAELVAAGHEVGLHGPDHAPVTGVGHRRVHERLAAARAELEGLVDQTVRWYRPPYGSQSAVSYSAAARAGLSTVLWSATTWDWKPATHEQRLAKVRQGARPGAILLAHDGIVDSSDGVSGEPDSGCDRPALIEEVLADFDRRSLAVVTVGEALAAGRPDRSLKFVLRPTRPLTY